MDKDQIHLIFTFIGGIYAIYLLILNIREKKSLFVFEIYTRLYDDPEIREILYAADKNENLDEIKIKAENGIKNINSERREKPKIVKLEKELDKTLRYLDYIGSLINNGRLSLKDIEHFKYEIREVLSNPIIIIYIDYLSKLKIKLNNLNVFEENFKQSKLMKIKLFLVQ